MNTMKGAVPLHTYRTQKLVDLVCVSPAVELRCSCKSGNDGRFFPHDGGRVTNQPTRHPIPRLAKTPHELG